MSADIPFALLHADIDHAPLPLRAAITAAYRRDERQAVQSLLAQLPAENPARGTAEALARKLVHEVRNKRSRASGVDALMHEFSLSSDEGVALMCLAEALLRIPDRETADRLIADKISKGDWRRHLGESPSLFVNAASWGLLITGKLVGSSSEHGLSAALTRLIARGGEPLIRKAVDLAMRMLGNQFVIGQTIDAALANSRDNAARGYRYSYDMLGEAALTEEDAANYFASYENAIHAIGRAAGGRGIRDGPGISVKLSALHPRYTRAQRARVMHELLPRMKRLFLLAKHYQIGLNIDAEEADRLELSLDLIEALALDAELAGFDGIGVVVQAYQKRCPYVIDYLIDLARRSGHRFMVRLVKGAYWDTEIKRAQVDGLEGYPVYTRKVYTDVSYLACARKLLAATDAAYPQFATHNAHTLATVYALAQQRGVVDYEFQCLYGMGETLYDQVVGRDKLDRPCRIYAPVGSHHTLLAYLVRRLLENGANSSFVNRLVDENVSIDALIADPVDAARELDGAPHPKIPLPADLFGSERRNSSGVDWSNEESLRNIDAALAAFAAKQWLAEPLLATGRACRNTAQAVLNPADRRDLVGHVIEADAQQLEDALTAAQRAAENWQKQPAQTRAAILEHAADLLERHQSELLALAVREAGKSLLNAVAEVREAVDFLRYYAMQIRTQVRAQTRMQAGQERQASALGVVACISPWNFPLAIFVGQVSASLAAGNAVLAKPAEQTPLIAFRAVQLLHEAGVPRDALQFLPGRGETVGAGLAADRRVDSVIFTGSTEVAQSINRTLSARAIDEGREIVLVAETGGQNAMIVDSSALPEQVVQDVIASAFDSAGQRCSALRVLCLQADIADRILAMLKGAMRELCVGKPDSLSTDIGPVIDEEAQRNLLAHIERMKVQAPDLFQLPLPDACTNGTFVPPTMIEISSLAQLQHEVFGPVLHVLRYRREALPQLVDAINASGYGLTLGIHTRIDETVSMIASRAHVGNIYVNRNMVGAVVGVQPFGGEGKSGTGPKAGGPLYLARLQRDATVQPHAQPAHASPSLNAVMSWARVHDESVARLGESYRLRSLWNTTVALPGPTGERNSLHFAARGNLLCVARTTDALLNQLAASFATGNTVVMPAAAAALLPAGLPDAVQAALTVVDETALNTVSLQGALLDAASAQGWLPLLAAREGALVPAIVNDSGQEIPVWRLVAERAHCVNTTAAGGNASLMTLDQ